MSRWGTSIETASGLYLDFLDPKPEQITVEDIARGLSMTCRFGGQVKEATQFFSVAEHAVRVSGDVYRTTEDAELAFAALHHDSHEAYLTDWPTPLKRALGLEAFDDIAGDLDSAIAKALGILWVDFGCSQIKSADDRALREEAAYLKRSRGVGKHWGTRLEAKADIPIECLPPAAAEDLFLTVHRAFAKESQCLPT